MNTRGPGKRSVRRNTDPSPYRVLDERRAREIRRWMEGERTDAPSRREIREFADWVADRIERDLARNVPVDSLITLLNQSAEVLRDHPEVGEESGDQSGAEVASDTSPEEPGTPGDDVSPDWLAPRSDEDWMDEALREARTAAAEGEVPVGALVVIEGRVLGRVRNQRERLHDPTAHAEMIAITQAAAALGTWRLDGCTMIVTLEPCPMCAGALVNARMGRLVYGADDPKAGACGTLLDIVSDPRLNHRLPVTSGVLREECGAILREFFRALRARGAAEREV
jgi:tRNA(adenine34) deaminase